MVAEFEADLISARTREGLAVAKSRPRPDEGARPAMAASPQPRSGDDTYDLIDAAVAALAGRRGTWLGDDIAAMALIASLIDQAERWLPQRMHDARANGHSWDEIARALATSPVEARLQFDPQSPVADGRWPYDF
jgi:hypothetical protein